MLKIIPFLLLLGLMAWTLYRRYLLQQTGTDSMNVYRLRLNGTPVFTRLHRFLSEQGLPQSASIADETHPVNTREDITPLTTKARETGYELYLEYNGLSMNYFLDGRLVISSIDLRKTENGLHYKDTLFDKNFTFSQFEELFPHSAQLDITGMGIKSLFETNTNEWLPSAESYMVRRWSKDNLLAQPTVEFTFLDGKLIYMFFANF